MKPCEKDFVNLQKSNGDVSKVRNLGEECSE